MAADDRKYFIVKHGFDAFQELPGYIWRDHDCTGRTPPHRFAEVLDGSRWIGFAYTSDDDRTRRLSLVTGFYECVSDASYAAKPTDRKTKAWMIKGREWGKQPQQPVAIPPLHVLLGRRLWENQTIIPINERDFCKVRQYVFNHQLDRNKIPLLRRDPWNEQELLAIVVSGHEKLGIKILRVQTRFPDLLVEIKGLSKPIHLELETYSRSFILHGHHSCCQNRKFNGEPVAVLCWIDDDHSEVSKYVRRIYELQDLIRKNDKIQW